MTNSPILAFYFDAPMQSYGVESRYDRRTSLPFPTRSAITGILCAAMGIERSDRVFLSEMTKLRMETLILPRIIPKEKKNASKELVASRLRDYHTVGGGYDSDKNKTEKFNIPRRVGYYGKDPVQSYREYLLDARFGILLSGDEAILKRCDTAMRDPVWGVWFGRKCCIPASRITQGFFCDRNKAVARLCELAGCKSPERQIREVDSITEGNDSRMDIPITFERHCRGMGGEFLPRQIVIEPYSE